VDLFAELNGYGSNTQPTSSLGGSRSQRPASGGSRSASSLVSKAMALWEDWKYTVYVFLPGAVLMYLYFKFSYVEEAI